MAIGKDRTKSSDNLNYKKKPKINIKKLVRINWKEIKKDTIIHYSEIGDLCHRPYPDHPEGCPNIYKCKDLEIPKFEDILMHGEHNHYYLIYANFDIHTYESERKKIYPNWSRKQLRNLLHWQNSVKKMLSDFIDLQSLTKRDYLLGCGCRLRVRFQEFVGSMEYSWINVFSTCKLNGIRLEINPQNSIHLVCLLCTLKPIRFKRQRQLMKFFD